MAAAFRCGVAGVFATALYVAGVAALVEVASVVSIVLNTGLRYLSVRVPGWWYGAGLVLATAVVPPANFAITRVSSLPNG